MSSLSPGRRKPHGAPPITDFQKDPYLCVIRPLVETYLAFYRLASRHIVSMGLTPSQFDVIAELGDTEDLTCAELSQATLITKGTLTGVLDRLEAKGLLSRRNLGSDRRATKVFLTPKGKILYRQVFPAHARYLYPYFEGALTRKEIQNLKARLLRLRDSLAGNRRSAHRGHRSGRSRMGHALRNGGPRQDHDPATV